MPNTSFIENLGQGMAAQATSGIMGLVLGGINDRRQIKQQQKLQDMQIAGNKQMIDYQKAKDLEMWKATNYPAQMQQIKEAGLNPALLYGMGGAGGSTTGGGAPSVQGGHAPTGGHEAIDSMGISMQAALMKAQVENIQADTKLKESTIPKTEAETQSLLQGVDNQKAQQELTKVQTALQNVDLQYQQASLNDRLEYIDYTVKMIEQHLQQAKNETFISTSTMNDKIKIIQQSLINSVLQAAATEQQITASKEEIKKWSSEIAQRWEQLRHTGS